MGAPVRTPDVMPERESLWTVKEVANFLKCSTSYVYKAAERDGLPALRIGRMLRFSPDAVRAVVMSAASMPG